MQKKYFQEAVGAFGQLGGDTGIELLGRKDTGDRSTSVTLIKDWLHLFLRIVDNASMREQLKQTLEGVL